MSMNETSDDYGIVDVVVSLCKNGRTGRLQINVGSKRGVFFFNDGQLVDARIGTLTGFAAVNLAISCEATVLNFDSSIEPPAPRFNDRNERELLKTRFGISAAGADTAPKPRSAGQGRLSLVAPPNATVPAKEPRPLTDGPATNDCVAPLNSAAVEATVAKTSIKRATAPLKGATTPLSAPQAATAPLRDLNVSPPEANLPPKDASKDPQRSQLRETVVPLRMAGSPPALSAPVPEKVTVSPLPEKVAVAPQPEKVKVDALAAPLPPEKGVPPGVLAPQTPSSRVSTAPLDDPRFATGDENETAQRSNQWAKIGSLLALESFSSMGVDAKSHLAGVTKKLGSVSQLLQARGTQSFYYLRDNKTAFRAALIALIVIPAAIVLTSYWSKGKETAPSATQPPVATQPPAATGSVQVPSVVPANTSSTSQPLATKATTSSSAPAAAVRQEASHSPEPGPRPAPTKSPDTSGTRPSQNVATVAPEKKANTTQVDEKQDAEEKPVAKLASTAITVQVRVEGGQVSEAYIKSRRPGMEGYEAAALRMARQRRYSKDTTTTETLVFQIKGEH